MRKRGDYPHSWARGEFPAPEGRPSFKNVRTLIYRTFPPALPNKPLLAHVWLPPHMGEHPDRKRGQLFTSRGVGWGWRGGVWFFVR